MNQGLETTFDQVVATLLNGLNSNESMTVQLTAEQSQFTRFNHAKVRQTGSVEDGRIKLTLMQNQRVASQEFSFTGDRDLDQHSAQLALKELRQEIPQLPEDPHLVLPSGDAKSRDVYVGELLQPDAVVHAILPSVQGLDFTGMYAGGALFRGYADSAGQQHWFATDSFVLDYSLFLENGQAVKGTFAGSHWDQEAYGAKLADSRQQAEKMMQPAKIIAKGQYRSYLAPAALAELIAMFSWGGVSEASLQQGGSALVALQRGEKPLSPLFTLKENFQRGSVPRFNELGEVAPTDLLLISQGKLVNTLISSRTAKEYGKVANGASGGEFLRSPEVNPGNLSSADILSVLDTGLYLSNLHYLNWSDRPTGRITGMTRYACFWVENGEIVAPIENLRFDESLYRCFGENLLALTDFQEFIPEVGTYDHRSLGGILVPGLLAEEFTYTL
jgi:predicted Zn-dependent protease